MKAISVCLESAIHSGINISPPGIGNFK